MSKPGLLMNGLGLYNSGNQSSVRLVVGEETTADASKRSQLLLLLLLCPVCMLLLLLLLQSPKDEVSMGSASSSSCWKTSVPVFFIMTWIIFVG